MTTTDNKPARPAVIDEVLRLAAQTKELTEKTQSPSAISFAIQLALLECNIAQTAILADLALVLHTERPPSDRAQSIGDREIDLAMGPSPEVLTQMLGATERRLDAEQRENNRLRARHAALHAELLRHGIAPPDETQGDASGEPQGDPEA